MKMELLMQLFYAGPHIQSVIRRSDSCFHSETVKLSEKMKLIS